MRLMNQTTADIRLDPDDMRTAPPRRTPALPVLAGLLIGLAGVAAWVWWSQESAPVVATVPVPAEPPLDAPQPTAEGGIQYPVAPPEDKSPLQVQAIPDALAQLLGRAAVTRFLITDDFPRRFVATLDNLGREHAPAQLWPVQPTPGRFTVEQRADGSSVIAAANAQRYTPFVEFASSVDSAAAVQLYARLYPLLQEAYRQLGFGNRYLNDRVVAVIDHLLAAPEPSQPPQVRLMEVKGPVPSTRPWVRYEFADPELQGLSAGQKMLVRMGPANERKLKQKLAELRANLVRAQQAGATSR